MDAWASRKPAIVIGGKMNSRLKALPIGETTTLNLWDIPNPMSPHFADDDKGQYIIRSSDGDFNYTWIRRKKAVWFTRVRKLPPFPPTAKF